MGSLPHPGAARQITNLAEWRTEHRAPGAEPLVGNWNTPAQATAVQFSAYNVGWGPPQPGPVHVEVAIFENGPWIHWWGTDPTELQVMALALMDAARAARNGDDPNAVARQEWTRRGGQPEPD